MENCCSHGWYVLTVIVWSPRAFEPPPSSLFYRQSQDGRASGLVNSFAQFGDRRKRRKLALRVHQLLKLFYGAKRRQLVLENFKIHNAAPLTNRCRTRFDTSRIVTAAGYTD
ncbi:MAG: hypothetical protein KatS3mg110_3788 [Pirellulaceae bacterium]|nr:MAG: hypothetical protein KatS3mg110_3775 [Pirellulaceae bacterium]GIW95747.1 MAG: hypothetical protein KatS3mg110_3788 [Pirellulaceae bacterium]